MPHIEFPYLRVAKIPLIPLRAFLAHLLRIDEMSFCAFHVDIILEMGEQVTLIIHSSVLISQYFACISPLLRNLPAFNTRASFNKVMVGTAVRDKLLMGALFCNTSIPKEENLVSFLNC